jgi:hypothetical protein
VISQALQHIDTTDVPGMGYGVEITVHSALWLGLLIYTACIFDRSDGKVFLVANWVAVCVTCFLTVILLYCAAVQGMRMYVLCSLLPLRFLVVADTNMLRALPCAIPYWTLSILYNTLCPLVGIANSDSTSWGTRNIKGKMMGDNDAEEAKLRSLMWWKKSLWLCLWLIANWSLGFGALYVAGGKELLFTAYTGMMVFVNGYYMIAAPAAYILERRWLARQGLAVGKVHVS